MVILFCRIGNTVAYCFVLFKYSYFNITFAIFNKINSQHCSTKTSSNYCYFFHKAYTISKPNCLMPLTTTKKYSFQSVLYLFSIMCSFRSCFNCRVLQYAGIFLKLWVNNTLRPIILFTTLKFYLVNKFYPCATRAVKCVFTTDRLRCHSNISKFKQYKFSMCTV